MFFYFKIMTECIICYKELTEKVRRFVCRKCHVNICIQCFKETIERGLYVPMCCSCHTILNYDDIISCTSKTYFKTRYIEHLAEVQFKMLTEQVIQTLYPLIYKIDNLLSLNINQIDIHASKLYNVNTLPTFAKKYNIYPNAITDFENFLFNGSINILYDSNDKPQFDSDIPAAEICKELENLQRIVPTEIFKDFLKRHWNINKHNISIRKEIDDLISGNNNKNIIIAKCEKCKLGVIIEDNENLNNNCIKYKCNTCKELYCPKCLANISKDNENHKCKDEDIASWEEIKKSTKLCPKCSSRIFRSMGCPQMFCTNCHTGFDWNSGKIINGNFHNPHRMEWLRNGGNQDNFNVCDGISKIERIGKIKTKNFKGEIPYYDEILKLYNYHNELLDNIRLFTDKFNKYNRIDYYNLLRWYYRNTKTDLFMQIKEKDYKADIKLYEKYKFATSTILSIITPIVDIIHDGILTIINLCDSAKKLNYESENENENVNKNENENKNIPELLTIQNINMPQVIHLDDIKQDNQNNNQIQNTNLNMNQIQNQNTNLNINQIQNQNTNLNMHQIQNQNTTNEISDELNENSNIKIRKINNNEPKFFKDIDEIFKNMIQELITFDNNLYSIENVVDNYIPHFMFYTIPNVLTGYSINLRNSGFKTLYQLYFILNELINVKPEWQMNYSENKEAVEKYIEQLYELYPDKDLKNKTSSKSQDILICKYLMSLYKSKLNIISIVYTTYLTELQKIILIKSIKDNFHFNNHSDTIKNRRNRNANRIYEFINDDFEINDFEINDL